MKAMQLREPATIYNKPLSLVDLPDPEPGAGEVRIRVVTCGLCHTDLHTVEGDLSLPKLPLVPGHQVVGFVDRLGEGVVDFEVGARVGVPWLHKTCGTCYFCGREEENLCDHANFTGLHVDGGFAELMVAPAAFVYPLPDRFNAEEVAPLLCAGIIGYRALRLSDVQPGEKLGLFGFGASAHVAIQVAIHRGIETYVFTRGEEHKRLASELGAVWTGNAADNPPERLDRAILFAPAGTMVIDMLRVLRKGGTASIASIYMSPIPEFDYGKYLQGERTLRSVTASTRADARELLALAAEIPVRTEVESFPLAEANEALIRLRERSIRGAGVLRVSDG